MPWANSPPHTMPSALEAARRMLSVFRCYSIASNAPNSADFSPPNPSGGGADTRKPTSRPDRAHAGRSHRTRNPEFPDAPLSDCLESGLAVMIAWLHDALRTFLLLR